MSSIHETAYPRFKPELTQRELEDIYTPSEDELKFARRYARGIPARLFIVILLKTVQRLGYFAVLADVPPPIISFLAKCIGARSVTPKDLQEHEKSNTRQRFIENIRTYVNIKSITKETNQVILVAATQAAQTKQELADIINVVIEELIRQRFELPAFSHLNRTAQRVRNHVNESYFCSLSDPLPPEVINQFNAMLEVLPTHLTSGWQQVKRNLKSRRTPKSDNILTM